MHTLGQEDGVATRDISLKVLIVEYEPIMVQRLLDRVTLFRVVLQKIANEIFGVNRDPVPNMAAHMILADLD